MTDEELARAIMGIEITVKYQKCHVGRYMKYWLALEIAKWLNHQQRQSNNLPNSNA